MLAKAANRPAEMPRDGDPIRPGRIYVAPADHHMLLEKDYIRVARGPKENRFRPALDPLFRSAAYVYGPRAVGVILSGALDDGTAGLWTIKLRGGTTIVQDPADALHRSMPLSALENVEVDHKLPAAEIGPLLGRLAREATGPAIVVPHDEQLRTEREVRIALGHDSMDEDIRALGESSAYTCPECHGVMTAIHEGHFTRFRCHTGHAYSPSTLLEATSETVEMRLWDAIRALDEMVFLLNGMGERLAKDGNTRAAEECFEKAQEMHARGEAIRRSAMETEELDAEKVKASD